jgi:hypothetical protein
MSDLSDKEVGELWERHRDNHDYYQEDQAEEICALIRKLVEEREEVIGWEHREGYREVPLNEKRNGWIPYLGIALSDFGIDPASWEK